MCISTTSVRNERQLDPRTWDLGFGLGLWDLCLRDDECLVASVSQMIQVNPS